MGSRGGGRKVARGPSSDHRWGMRILVAALLLSSCADEETLPQGHECTESVDCFDDVVCNGAERCHRGFCLEGIAQSCDDGRWDTRDRCSEDAGTCVHEPYDGG